ncbi:MAG: tetratricopeptide repeat protein [Planctomycetes bacterium]|nr:tetratricopeptide repeat protein [Planctomycetota bacterium]
MTTDAPTWICPHCQREAEPRATSQSSVVQCPACEFAFPSADFAAQELEAVASARVDETQVDVPLPIPTDRYQVHHLIAKGSQGKILLAHHRHLDLPCVIKTISVDDEEWIEVASARLRSEARAGSRVNHPNVARVLDCDCVGGSWYFVMEYVAGVNMRTMLDAVGRLTWAQVAEVGIRSAHGLAAIHDAELIHRDIKPSNLMITPEGAIKITDLGLVKMLQDAQSPSTTQSGQLLGTPYYMPPEQFDAGGALDARADLYSLGATLFHLAAGKPPHQGSGLLDLSMKHQQDPVVWPQDLRDQAPDWFRHAIEACLAKRPEHRPPSASALVELLKPGAAQGSHAGQLAAPGGDDAVQGLVVLRLRNLSGEPKDDWIGDAVAEYLSHRLMELGGPHVANRQAVERVLNQTSPEWLTDPQRTQVLDAARLAGARWVIMGSYQTAGSKLMMTVQAQSADHPDPEHIARETAELNQLFDLEDSLARRLIDWLGRHQPPDRRRSPASSGTSSVAANEQLTLGQRAFAEGDYREAIRLGEEALRLDGSYAEPLSLIGACYARIGDYDRAVEFHQRQERKARKAADQPLLAEALGNLGVMYYYKGEYAEAYEFLQQAKQLSDKLDLHADAAKYLGNLGFVLVRLNRHAEAEEAFADAIDLHRQVGDLVALVWPYNGMGTVLLKQQRYGEAKEYYQRALLLAEEIGDRVNVGISHMNLGRCACLIEDYDEARSRFRSALSILEGTDFWNGLTLVYEHLAEMHLRLEEFGEALESVDQRIDLARRHDNQRMEAAGWEQKARVYELMKDTDQALVCLKHSVDVSQHPVPHESLHRYLGVLADRTPFH